MRKRYGIGGIFSPRIELEIEGVPPCFQCGDPVYELSAAGPLICARCDCGINRAGQPKTAQEFAASVKLFREMMERYRVDPLLDQLAVDRLWYQTEAREWVDLGGEA